MRILFAKCWNLHEKNIDKKSIAEISEYDNSSKGIYLVYNKRLSKKCNRYTCYSIFYQNFNKRTIWSF